MEGYAQAGAEEDARGAIAEREAGEGGPLV